MENKSEGHAIMRRLHSRNMDVAGRSYRIIGYPLKISPQYSSQSFLIYKTEEKMKLNEQETLYGVIFNIYFAFPVIYAHGKTCKSFIKY